MPTFSHSRDYKSIYQDCASVTLNPEINVMIAFGNPQKRMTQKKN